MRSRTLRTTTPAYGQMLGGTLRRAEPTGAHTLLYRGGHTPRGSLATRRAFPLSSTPAALRTLSSSYPGRLYATATSVRQPETANESDPLDDPARLAQRDVFRSSLRLLEQSQESIAPRQYVNMLRACILDRREKLKEMLPRVLDLHNRVKGGDHIDGSAMLAALSYIGDQQAAFAEYERLKREGIKCYELNYGHLVEVCASQRDLDKAFSVVDMMRQDRHLLVEGKPTTFVFNRLILACGKLRNLPRAYEVFVLMHEEGLRPSRTTFASYVDACAMVKDLYSGIKVLSQMKVILGISNKKFRLDPRYITSLIPGCDSPHGFDRVIAELIREGTPANEDTLAALIAGCTNNGGLARAFEMFKELRLFWEQQARERQAQGISETDDESGPNPHMATHVIRKPSLSGRLIFF